MHPKRLQLQQNSTFVVLLRDNCQREICYRKVKAKLPMRLPKHHGMKTWVSGRLHAPAALSPGKSPDTHWIGG